MYICIIKYIDIYIVMHYSVCFVRSDLLAETEGDLQTPGEVDGAVQVLQSLHAVLPLALGDVAVLQHGEERVATLEVVVTQLQSLVARTLEHHGGVLLGTRDTT